MDFVEIVYSRIKDILMLFFFVFRELCIIKLNKTAENNYFVGIRELYVWNK